MLIYLILSVLIRLGLGAGCTSTKDVDVAMVLHVNNSRRQVNRTHLLLAHSLYIQHWAKSNNNLFTIETVNATPEIN